MTPLSLAHRRRLSAPTPFPQQLAEMEAELSGDLPCSPGLSIEPRTVAEVEAGVPMRRKPDLRLVESAAREEEALLLRNRSLIERVEDRPGPVLVGLFATYAVVVLTVLWPIFGG